MSVVMSVCEECGAPFDNSGFPGWCSSCVEAFKYLDSLEAAYLDPENDPRFLNEDDRDWED